MDWIIKIAQQHQISLFLLITFIVSGVAFSFMWLTPKWQTPENFDALPIWIMAVWSPTISAIIVWSLQGQFINKLKLLFSIPAISPWFLILLIPIIIIPIILQLHPSHPASSAPTLTIPIMLMILLLNLSLGPLGEEAGWRGFLLPAFQHQYGWLGAALLIGIIWILWHAPLWMISSPQAEISFLVFCGHVLCYSILMTIIYMESNGSIIPVILFHLLVNVITAYLAYLTAYHIAEIYKLTLYYYAAATVLSIGLYELINKKICVY